MKILVVADLHYTLRQWDWLVQVAENVDLIVIAGDLLDLGSRVEMDVQILVTLRYIRRLRRRTRLAIASGNHDLRPTESEHEARWLQQVRCDKVAIDYDAISLGDSLISVLPWHEGPITKQRCIAMLESHQSTRLGSWIWVHHAPPQNSAVSWTGKTFYGDPLLREWIGHYRPDIVLSGHVHNAPFSDEGSWKDLLGSTWVFNPGRQIGAVPTHMILDLDTQTMAWYSLDAYDQTALKASLCS